MSQSPSNELILAGIPTDLFDMRDQSADTHQLGLHLYLESITVHRKDVANPLGFQTQMISGDTPRAVFFRDHNYANGSERMDLDIAYPTVIADWRPNKKHMYIHAAVVLRIEGHVDMRTGMLEIETYDVELQHFYRGMNIKLTLKETQGLMLAFHEQVTITGVNVNYTTTLKTTEV